MKDENFELVRDLFLELCELPAEDRIATLEGKSLDGSIVAEVRGLLDELAGDQNAISDVCLADVPSRLVQAGEEQGMMASLPKRIGPYRVLRRLGKGGMGIVYAGRHDETAETVALKLIRPALSGARLMERFQREARVLARLKHPGIASFLGTGQTVIYTDTGKLSLPYLALELIEGETLTLHCDRSDLQARDRIELIARVCDALQHAHIQGVVHRDLKPNNILVVPDAKGSRGLGQPKVLDFGVAYVIGIEEGESMTTTGALLGTVPYMSPEQLSGDADCIDGRSDLYTLGVVLFELLTGHLPYDVRDRSLPVAARIVREGDPSSLSAHAPGLGQDIEIIIRKVLEKRPEDRYRDADSFAADLRSFIAGRQIQARPPSLKRRVRGWVRRHKVATGALISLSLGLASTSFFALELWRATEETRTIADLRDRAAYRAHIAAAAASIRSQDVASAEHNLSQCSVSRRGWEWHLLNTMLDDSVSRIPTEDQLPSRFEMLAFGSDSARLRLLTWEPLPRQGNHREWSVPELVQTSSHEFTSQLVPTFGAHSTTHLELRLRDDGASLELVQTRVTDGEPAASIPLPIHPNEIASRPLIPTPDEDQVLILTDTDIYWVDCARGHAEKVEGWPGHISKAVAVDSQRRRIVFFGEQGLSVFDRLSMEVFPSSKPLISRPRSFHISPDGKAVAVIYLNDPRVQLWNLEDEGGLTLRRTLVGHTDDVRCLAFAPDSSWLITGGQDRVLRVWDAKTGDPRRLLLGHRDSVEAVAVSADGAFAASATVPGDVRLWSAPNLNPRVLEHPDYVYRARFDARGQRILTACWDDKLRVFDVASRELIAEIESEGDCGDVEDLAVDPKGRWFASVHRVVGSGQRISAILVHSADTGERIARLDPEVHLPGCRIAVSPGGAQLVATGTSGRIIAWSTVDWKPLESLQRMGGEHNSSKAVIAFDPSGERIGVDSPDGGIEILDADNLRSTRSLGRSGPKVTALAFDPLVDRVAVGAESGDITLLDSDEDSPPVVLRGHTDTVHWIAFSPDGQRMASVSHDRTLRLWNLEELAQVAVLFGHADYVYTVDYSPSGDSLLTASGDATARIWDLDPIAVRTAAIAERARIVNVLGPRVEKILETLAPQQAADRVRAMAELSTREREVALQLILESACEAR